MVKTKKTKSSEVRKDSILFFFLGIFVPPAGILCWLYTVRHYKIPRIINILIFIISGLIAPYLLILWYLSGFDSGNNNSLYLFWWAVLISAPYLYSFIWPKGAK